MTLAARPSATTGPGAAVLAMLLLLAAGCSNRGANDRSGARGSAAPDTLLATLSPRLADWIALWQLAAPAVRAESLLWASSGPLTLADIRAFQPRSAEAARRLAWFAALAPDSARAVDADTCYDFDPASNAFHRGPPRFSCAILMDLKINSVATLDTCGAGAEFDGALWLGPERFALTGATTDGDTTGAGRGFVRLYDLGAGTVTEYRLPRVVPAVFQRFHTEREIARIARLRRLAAGG